MSPMKMLLCVCICAIAGCVAMHQKAPIPYAAPCWTAKHSNDGRRLASHFGNESGHWIALYDTRTMIRIGTAVPGDLVEFSPDSVFIWVRSYLANRPYITLYRALNMEQIDSVAGSNAFFAADSTRIYVQSGDPDHSTRQYRTSDMLPVKSTNQLRAPIG